MSYSAAAGFASASVTFIQQLLIVAMKKFPTRDQETDHPRKDEDSEENL